MLLTIHEHLGSPQVFGGVLVAHLVSFLCCLFFSFFFCFICLLPVCLLYTICPLSFKIWIFRNGQSDRDGDYILFVTMTST
jgi:hypothetical protein